MGEVAAFKTVQSTRHDKSTRLLVRRETPLWPFIWRGLAPALGLLLLMLYALWPFAKGEIEDNVRRSVNQVLAEQGLDGVKVLVSGQQVFLSGELKPGFSSLQVLNIARQARCPTWLGPQACPELVLGQFTQAAGMPVVPTAQDVSAQGNASTGVEPSTRTRSPTSSGAAAARQSCERALAEAIRIGRIEFAVGSARLLPRSFPVLDGIVQAQKACEGAGKVRVEGHTDNRGAAPSNQVLSLARADAVRAELVSRGFPAESLVTAGLGASQPIADNDSEAGRQANRRIEFKVVVDP